MQFYLKKSIREGRAAARARQRASGAHVCRRRCRPRRSPATKIGVVADYACPGPCVATARRPVDALLDACHANFKILTLETSDVSLQSGFHCDLARARFFARAGRWVAQTRTH